jgi:hypothetical protein
MIYTRAGQLHPKEGPFVKDWPEDCTCAYVNRNGGGGVVAVVKFEFTRTPLITKKNKKDNGKEIP